MEAAAASADDNSAAADSVVASTQREDHNISGETTLLRGVVRSVRRMGKRLAFVLVDVESENVDINCDPLSTSEARAHDTTRTEEETQEICILTATYVQATCAREDIDTSDPTDAGKTVMADHGKSWYGITAPVNVEPHDTATVQLTVRKPEWIRTLRPGCVVTAQVTPERGGAPSSRDGQTSTKSDRVGGSSETEDKHRRTTETPGNRHPVPTSSGSALAQQRAQYECASLLEITTAPGAGHDDGDSEGQRRQANGSKRRRVGDAQQRPTPPCRWFLQGKPCPVDSCERRHFFATAAEQRQCEAKRSSAERMRSALVASAGT